MRKHFAFLLTLFVTTSFAQKPEVVVTSGHTNAINAIAYTNDGAFIATASLDRTIIIWEGASNKELRTIHGKGGAFTNISIHPNGQLLLSLDYNKNLILWDITNGKELMTFQCTSSNRVFGFLSNGKYIGYFGNDEKFHIYDHQAKSEVKTFDFGYPFKAGVSAKGNRLAVVDLEKVLHIYDANTGQELGSFQTPGTYPFINLIFSPNEKYLATSYSDQKVHIYDLSKMKKHSINTAHKALLKDAVFSKNSKELISVANDNMIISYDLSKKSIKYSIPTEILGANCLTIQPDNKVLAASGTGKNIVLYDLATGKKLNIIKSVVPYVSHVAYDQKGKHMATYHGDATIKVWNVEQNKLAHTYWGIFPLAFINDGTQIASLAFGKDYKMQIMVRDVLTADTVRFISCEGEQLQKLVSSHDQKYLAGTGIFHWDVKLWDVESGEIIKKFKGSGAGAHIHGIDISRDNRFIAFGEGQLSGPSAKAFVYEIESGKKVAELTGQITQISDVKFSPDGSLLATSAWDHSIKVWNTSDWSLKYDLEGHEANVLSIDFTNDGKQLLSAAGALNSFKFDNTIKIWDMSTGQETCTMHGHSNAILKLINDQQSISSMTVSNDGSIKTWNRSSCSEAATTYAVNRDDYVIFTPDNYYTASKGALSGISFRINNKLYPFEQFDLRLNRPDIVASRIGKTPQILVEAYYEAYRKRLKRLGFTEEQLGKDYHVPKISIDRNNIPAVTESSAISIPVNASDDLYALDRILISLNGVPMFGEKGIDLTEKSIHAYEKSINLNLASGKNKVQVSVMNEKGIESLKESFEIVRNVEEEHQNLYLIEIDVSNYKDENFNLKYPSKDAKDFRETLEKTKALYDNIYEKELKDEDATIENFAKLYDFLKDVSIDDVVIVYIVGHGVLDEKLDYYYGTHDIDFNNPAARGLSYEAIEQLLASVKAIKKLLIMDTCHSGEVDKENTEITNDAPEENKEKGGVKFRAAGAHVRTKQGVGLNNSYELMTLLFADLKNGTGATVMSSAGGAEYAFEGDDWENGLFTYCMLKGMTEYPGADYNADKKIMLSELRRYVYEEVVRLSGGKQKPTARQENLQNDFRIW